MIPFTDRVANLILERELPLQHLTVIVPSERMIGYLQRSLFEADGQPKIAPKIVTIDRWIQDLADKPVMDKTRLLFQLYEIFRKDPVEYEANTFDAFMSWGQLLLSDFDEIDRYLVPPKQLFKNLRDIREIENWSFNQEELSPGQLKFMAFWDKLGPYYNALSEQLDKDGQTTKGKAYRDLAENIDLVFRKDKKAQFVFAGFNALSVAELNIMKQLYVMGRAQICMDSDTFYLHDEFHEAGSFQRVLAETLQVKSLPFVADELRSKTAEVQIVECAQTTGQAKVVGTWLSELSAAELNETLVLLADEQLIVSLIQHLPASIGKANITLGLPLRATSLRLWVDLLFRIQEQYLRRKSKSVYYKEVSQYFHHPFIQGLVTQEEMRTIARLEASIVDKNRLFLSRDELELSERLSELNRLVFEPWGNDWQQAMVVIRKINAVLDDLLKTKNLLEKAVLRSFDHALTGLQNCIAGGIPEMQLGTFRNVFNQHWSKESMSYFGNPMEGLQIMGLLETRGLDFKRIIVMGLNEGTMPPTNPIQTLIPMDLRRFFRLPTPREKQGLFAHHFYRLLHCAEDVRITYAAAQEGMGAQEPSRFIQQMELEWAVTNPNLHLHKRYYTLGNKELIIDHEVVKTQVVIQRLDDLLKEGITFSKLNAFLDCPLNFYYRYVLRIGEESKVEESIESNTLGTILHEVLEELLMPFSRANPAYVENGITPRPVTQDDWKKMQDAAPLHVDKSFQQHFSEDPSVYASGTNHITYVVAQEIIRKVLQREIAVCEEQPQRQLQIEALEYSIEVQTAFELNGSKRETRIQGILDRIDFENGRFRVIDYKSGGVGADAVSVNIGKSADAPVEAILKKIRNRGTKHHVLQLLIYCYLFRHAYKRPLDEVGIFSFINTSESPFLLDFKGDISLEEATGLVEEVIHAILRDIYDTNVSFKHRHGAKYCLYCAK